MSNVKKWFLGRENIYNCRKPGESQDFLEYLESIYGRQTVFNLLSGRRQEGVVFHATYYPDVNEYMGNRSIQMVISHYTISKR